MSLENLTILIPTYNRYQQLKKTLRTYVALGITNKIVVLDGSHETNSKKNEDLVCKINLNISYKLSPNTSFLERLINELDTYKNDDLICLGNDEDVYLPCYLENGYKFLIENPDYSTYIGQYLTHQKKLFTFNRISYWRNTFSDVDINLESSFRRLILLQRLINGGCSPIFWGIRKAHHFKESLIIQKEIKLESTQEVADIVHCAYVGKIRFNKEIMLWRDERNLKLDEHPGRSETTNFIDINKRDELVNAFKDWKLFTYNEQMDSFLDWYFIKSSSTKNNSFNMYLHQKSYSRLENLGDSKILNTIIFLDKVFKIFNELFYSFFWNIKLIKEKKYKAYRIFNSQ